MASVFQGKNKNTYKAETLKKKKKNPKIERKCENRCCTLGTKDWVVCRFAGNFLLTLGEESLFLTKCDTEVITLSIKHLLSKIK